MMCRYHNLIDRFLGNMATEVQFRQFFNKRFGARLLRIVRRGVGGLGIGLGVHASLGVCHFDEDWRLNSCHFLGGNGEPLMGCALG